ncbi:aminotransferase class IV [Schumannella sp. 10F1B-5-1]|uniref:aminotransferase class IV n=1 Tax=Schumannella sp. 10F1B-5-1 TaxID=2590780 RepID=UPI00113060DC|nr:aminotransferase class IV [Schumannella sp. 10F1B-5-1]TPW70200.1 hypothetical protein FJ658_14370 [Schumannella sp. 10F1B-5-1]
MTTTYRWQRGPLAPADDCDVVPSRVLAADSWLVVDGRVRGLGLHRSRFADAVAAASAIDAGTADVDAVLTVVPDPLVDAADLDDFWDAALALIPREGSWFPRVELVGPAEGSERAPELRFRLRPAPELRSSVRLVTAARDPRTQPRVKGPDLAAMTALRAAAQGLGADEAVVLEADGAVAEGSTTCLLWWRGDMLCVPEDDIARVDSVTLRSILALATALGLDVLHERATPSELDGLEIWAVNAVHGVRIVTEWIDGPAPAELPGRRAEWQARLDALRRPLPPAPVLDRDAEPTDADADAEPTEAGAER